MSLFSWAPFVLGVLVSLDILVFLDIFTSMDILVSLGILVFPDILISLEYGWLLFERCEVCEDGEAEK